jgi:hypothetical protein
MDAVLGFGYGLVIGLSYLTLAIVFVLYVPQVLNDVFDRIFPEGLTLSGGTGIVVGCAIAALVLVSELLAKGKL